MASERKENWIQITTPEGKKLIASPSYIKNLLNLNLPNIYFEIRRLEARVNQLEAPGRQAEILELLYKQGKHNRVWISNRVMNYQRYDLGQLLEAGLIVESKAGSVTMYSCARLVIA